MIEICDKLKAELARCFRVPVDELKIVDGFPLYERDCYRFYSSAWNFVDVTTYEIERLCPKPDPFVEAFTTIALALHESEKEFERRGQALIRILRLA